MEEDARKQESEYQPRTSELGMEAGIYWYFLGKFPDKNLPSWHVGCFSDRMMGLMHFNFTKVYFSQTKLGICLSEKN